MVWVLVWSIRNESILARREDKSEVAMGSSTEVGMDRGSIALTSWTN